MNKTHLEDWLKHLETLHPTEMELSLERVRQVACALDLLSPTVPVVTIAGTNGKGTTAAALEMLLLATGRRPGVFTSPHLLRFNERICVAGVEVVDEAIVMAFRQIETARASTSLTYFEFTTLAALLVFREQACDVIVLEVGLGGRLDATNIVDADVAVITSIGLDHERWLGSGRNLIAREKAGILRVGKPAVIAEADPPPDLLAAVADSGCQPWWIGRDFNCEQMDAGWYATLRDRQRQILTLPVIAYSSLVPSNLCAALQVLLLLGESPPQSELPVLFAKLAPSGRGQHIRQGGVDYILDVAHNPDSVKILLERLSPTNCNKKVYALFSVMADKDFERIIRQCTKAFDGWFVAEQPDNPRAATAAQLVPLLQQAGECVLGIGNNLPQALALAQQKLKAGEQLVIFGSFFTVAAMLPLLTCDPDRKKP
ncbi:MAG: bifunctional folylpolyglutamate synthase/dihydrofolate synthase [Parahaliea sp.]